MTARLLWLGFAQSLNLHEPQLELFGCRLQEDRLGEIPLIDGKIHYLLLTHRRRCRCYQGGVSGHRHRLGEFAHLEHHIDDRVLARPQIDSGSNSGAKSEKLPSNLVCTHPQVPSLVVSRLMADHCSGSSRFHMCDDDLRSGNDTPSLVFDRSEIVPVVT